jgi:hypothetical protein
VVILVRMKPLLEQATTRVDTILPPMAALRFTGLGRLWPLICAT